ncbi:hypothetical protein [Nocardia sp. NBC_01329]|uniref:hypothetical protein n=1 Tax=Nocardia sp. NBC_01329 TaxID=2903594 RepID=UPI002E0D930E|nr:hypothetical protein OG405_28065 [Nocardia sp. NBC_01329]
MAESAGTDPPYAPERECFGSFTHQEIWDRVHEVLDPGALGDTAAAWKSNADAVADAFAAFTDTARREFDRWSGHSANAARQATLEFIVRGNETHEACRALQRLMESNTEAAQTLRSALAPPQPYRPLDDPATEAVHGGRRRMDHDIAAAAAAADAQDAMTTIYNPTLPASGDCVPRFPGTAADGSPRR